MPTTIKKVKEMGKEHIKALRNHIEQGEALLNILDRFHKDDPEIMRRKEDIKAKIAEDRIQLEEMELLDKIGLFDYKPGDELKEAPTPEEMKDMKKDDEGGLPC